MYKHIKALTFFIIAIGVFNSIGVVGQTLLTPDLNFGTSACDDIEGKKDFVITIRVGGSTFNSDNTFTIELSDANGSFTSPTIVREITDASVNGQFNPSVSFQLPDGTFGTGYKIRVQASSPAATSPESNVFAAYDMIVPDPSNGGLLGMTPESGVLCGDESLVLTIVDGKPGEFDWYKDDVLFTTTTDPELTVTEPGRYEARIDYGVCGNLRSFNVTVTGLSTANAQIVDNTGTAFSSTVEICANESVTFFAKEQNTTLYNYQWFKDGSAISGATGVSYVTPAADQFGKYKVEIQDKNGTCKVESSQEVELKQRTDPDFSVTPTDDTIGVLLSSESRRLCIELVDVTEAEVTIQWFNGTNPVPTANQLCIDVPGPGAYFAQVTKNGTGGGCDVVVNSGVSTLLGVQEFHPTIEVSNPDEYVECEFTSVKLITVGVEATATDGNRYQLSSDQLTMLSYQWYLNDTAVSGATLNELDVNSFLDNGTYRLNVSRAGFFDSPSNDKDIKLIAPNPVISSSQTSNSLCPGGTIRYTIDEFDTGYTYEWYKDAETTPFAVNELFIDVTETGSYTLKFFDANCSKTLDPIEIVPFDESVVQVTPSEVVVLQQGQTVTVTASGAESYTWYQGEDTSGTILSANETLNVSALGFYTVVAKVGSCEVTKTIEAVEQDDQIIVPNIVTPNGDGINDTWQITNRLAYQPTVDIIIYNANGKEVFKTSDYQNNWPVEDLGNQRVFYYKIIKEEVLVKAGTISVLD